MPQEHILFNPVDPEYYHFNVTCNVRCLVRSSTFFSRMKSCNPVWVSLHPWCSAIPTSHMAGKGGVAPGSDGSAPESHLTTSRGRADVQRSRQLQEVKQALGTRQLCVQIHASLFTEACAVSQPPHHPWTPLASQTSVSQAAWWFPKSRSKFMNASLFRERVLVDVIKLQTSRS